MEWDQIWRTVFCGRDGDTAGAAPPGDRLGPPAHAAGTGGACGHAAAARPARTEDDDAAAWVCRRIQQAF
jgi:hypothetical protein